MLDVVHGENRKFNKRVNNFTVNTRFALCVHLHICYLCPCDGLTDDGFLRFSECVSYPPPFSLLYSIFYG